MALCNSSSESRLPAPEASHRWESRSRSWTVNPRQPAARPAPAAPNANVNFHGVRREPLLSLPLERVNRPSTTGWRCAHHRGTRRRKSRSFGACSARGWRGRREWRRGGGAGAGGERSLHAWRMSLRWWRAGSGAVGLGGCRAWRWWGRVLGPCRHWSEVWGQWLLVRMGEGSFAYERALAYFNWSLKYASIYRGLGNLGLQCDTYSCQGARVRVESLGLPCVIIIKVHYFILS